MAPYNDDVTNMFWDMSDSSQIRIRNELVKTFRMDLKAFIWSRTNFTSVDNFVDSWRRMIIDWNSRIGDIVSEPVHENNLWGSLSGIHREVMNTTTFIHEMGRKPHSSKEIKQTILKRFIDQYDHLSFLDTCLEY
jgi:hypothetical protein